MNNWIFMCGNAVLNLIMKPLSPQKCSLEFNNEATQLNKKSKSNVLRYEPSLFIYTNIITWLTQKRCKCWCYTCMSMLWMYLPFCRTSWRRRTSKDNRWVRGKPWDAENQVRFTKMSHRPEHCYTFHTIFLQSPLTSQILRDGIVLWQYFETCLIAIEYRLLDSLVVECWLLVREVAGSIPSQGPRLTKDVIKMVPVVPLFITEYSKGKYWLFLKNNIRK